MNHDRDIEIQSPRAELAGCFHLARLVNKIRLHQSGELPPEFSRYLFHPRGLDGVLLSYFGLVEEDMRDAVLESKGDDSRIESWFEERVGRGGRKRSDWNELAVNLGRPGFPMAESFGKAKRKVDQCDDPGVDTCFKLLDWDEGRL